MGFRLRRADGDLAVGGVGAVGRPAPSAGRETGADMGFVPGYADELDHSGYSVPIGESHKIKRPVKASSV